MAECEVVADSTCVAAIILPLFTRESFSLCGSDDTVTGTILTSLVAATWLSTNGSVVVETLVLLLVGYEVGD